MLILGILSVLCGLSAIAAGAVDLTRAINPTYLQQQSDFLYRLPAVAPAAALAVLTIILVIICRSLARGRTRRRYGTSGAILAAVLGVVIALVALPVTNVFPDGVVKPAQSSSKDLPQSAGAAQQQVTEATGKCAGGWNSIDTSNYPGVSSVSVCVSDKLAFAVFDSPAVMSILKAPLQSQAVKYLTEHLDTTQIAGLPAFSTLTGSQWIAIGPSADMTALRQHQGGIMGKLDIKALTGAQ